MTDINILDQFLQTFSPEVVGRSCETLTPEMEAKLAQFARGELPEGERVDVSRELLTNQAAVDFLLARVKA